MLAVCVTWVKPAKYKDCKLEDYWHLVITKTRTFLLSLKYWTLCSCMNIAVHPVLIKMVAFVLFSSY
jgi:hypothetical protein